MEETLCTTESLYQLLIHPEAALIIVNQNALASWTLHYKDHLLLRLHHLMSQLIEHLHCKFSFFLLICSYSMRKQFIFTSGASLRCTQYKVHNITVWSYHLVMAKSFRRWTKLIPRPLKKILYIVSTFPLIIREFRGRVPSSLFNILHELFFFSTISSLNIFRIVKVVIGWIFQLQRPE